MLFRATATYKSKLSSRLTPTKGVTAPRSRPGIIGMAHHSFILVGHNRTAPSGATETNAPHNIDIDVLEMEAMVSALPRVRKLFLSHRPTPMTAIRIRASTRSLSPVLIAKTAIIEIHDNGAGSNAIDAATNAS